MKSRIISSILIALFILVNVSGAFAAPQNANVRLNESFATPDLITGNLSAPSASNAEDVVFNYLEASKDTFKLTGTARNSFIVKAKDVDAAGTTRVTVQQSYKGVPVFGYTQKSLVDKNGVLKSVSGAVIPNLDKQSKLKSATTVTAAAALKTAQSDLSVSPEYTTTPTASLVVYMNGTEASYAYFINLSFLSPVPGNWNYFVDAVSGQIIDKYNTIDAVTGTSTTNQGVGVLGDTKTINVVKTTAGTYYTQDNTRGNYIYSYNANHGTSVPSTPWSSTTGVWNTSTDHAIVDAHYYVGRTYDYYKATFGRNGYNRSGAVPSTVSHYSTKYNNAFSSGSYIVFGDGDGVMFRELSGGLDVIAHEYTHAVSTYEANLTYKNESGAISEAYSDIFGTLVEYYDNRTPDWDMGEDIYTPGTAGDALRSLSDPKKYGYPDRYADRYTGSSDNGGVHTNCAIISKAAYLISEGGTLYGVTVTGIGKAKLGAIFYKALYDSVVAGETFTQLRAHTITAATSLYGSGSAEVTAVTKAFTAVGVN